MPTVHRYIQYSMTIVLGWITLFFVCEVKQKKEQQKDYSSSAASRFVCRLLKTDKMATAVSYLSAEPRPRPLTYLPLASPVPLSHVFVKMTKEDEEKK